jgi:proteasome accessory factor B
MSTKLHRWIDLASALLSRRYGATLEELRGLVPGYAEGQAESMRRTFERDKDELRALGVPIETGTPNPEGETRYVLRTTDFYLPYLAIVSERGRTAPARVNHDGYRALAECEFTDTELALLADAAARVALLGDPVLTSDAQHALAKLGMDAGHGLTPTPGISIATGRTAADPAVLEELGDALLRRKQVTFTYYGIERDESERRTVLPYGLAYTGGHWYLHVHDPARGDLRRFRVSRMRELAVNPKAPGTRDFEIPAHFHLADVAVPVPAWQLGDDTVLHAQVRFSIDSAAVHAARTLGTTDAAGITTFAVCRREPFHRWLLSFAGDADVIGPPDARREYRELIARTRAAQEAA